jgi:hypothetical protein
MRLLPIYARRELGQVIACNACKSFRAGDRSAI